MYFKNEMMGFIQLGKAPDKLLNKSSKGHKGLLAKQAPPAQETSGCCSSKINSKKKQINAGIIKWSTAVDEFIFRLTTVLGTAHPQKWIWNLTAADFQIFPDFAFSGWFTWK